MGIADVSANADVDADVDVDSDDANIDDQTEADPW